MRTRKTTNLGDLINGIYENYLSVYGDSELALIATEVTISEMIHAAEQVEEEEYLAA